MSKDALKIDESKLQTSRLNPRAVESVLSKLDVADQSFTGVNKRSGTRFRYRRQTGVVVTIFQEQGVAVRHAVSARDLSEKGVSFLHANYIPDQTKCVLSLETISGKWTHIVGHVVRCQLLTACIHEAAIHFVNRIDLSQLITESSDSDISFQPQAPKLVGRVLYIDDCIDDRELMRFLLGRLGVKVVMTANSEEALAMVEGKVPLDLLITDYHPAGVNGLEVLSKLNDLDCELPRLMITCDESIQVHEQAMAAGCQAVLHKPLDMDQIGSILLQFLPLAESTGTPGKQHDRGPLKSLYGQDHDMQPLIGAFLKRLKERVEQLRAYQEQGAMRDVDEVSNLCLRLKGSAGGYGYPQISQAVQQLQAIEAGDTDAWVEQCQQLIDLCARALLVQRDTAVAA